jgi:DNA-binding transcriptional ArsR family regulator
MSRPALHAITTPKTWSLLVAPARIEIVEAMRIAAPCSIAEIAEILDRPADTLYRHVEKLVRAGLVLQSGVRRRGRRFEQLFDLVADDFRFAFRDGSGRAANKAFEECANSFLKSAMRAVRDSARAGQLVAKDDERNLALIYELGRLTPAGFREVRALVTRIKELMDQGKRSPEGRLYLSVSVLTPVTRKRGAARRSAEQDGSAPGAKKSPKSLPKTLPKFTTKPTTVAAPRDSRKPSTSASRNGRVARSTPATGTGATTGDGHSQPARAKRAR